MSIFAMKALLLAGALQQPSAPAGLDDPSIASLLAAMHARESQVEAVESHDEAWWPPNTAKPSWTSMGTAERGWHRDGRWYMLHTDAEAQGGDSTFYIAGNGKMIAFVPANKSEPRILKLNGLLKEPSVTVRDGDKSVPVFLGLTVETLRDRTTAELFDSATAIRTWKDPAHPDWPGLECDVSMYGHHHRLRVLLDSTHGYAIRYFEEFDAERSFPLQRFIVTSLSQHDGLWIPERGAFCSYTLTQIAQADHEKTLAEDRKSVESAPLPPACGEPERTAALQLIEGGQGPEKDLYWRPLGTKPNALLVPQIWSASSIRVESDLASLAALTAPHLGRGLMDAWTYGHSTIGETLPKLGYPIKRSDVEQPDIKNGK